MPGYKLFYFNLRGRAELSRWLFAEAGVEYEDVRIPGEAWPQKKKEFPFKQMPVLQVTDDGGKTTFIAQSHAIERFLAREFGLVGKTNLDAARTDMLGEHLHDTLMKLPWTETDEEKKDNLLREAVEGPMANDFALLETFVQDNGFFVGDDVTIADIGFTVGCEWFIDKVPNALEKTPKLKAMYGRVRELPQIKAWISKRPQTAI